MTQHKENEMKNTEKNSDIGFVFFHGAGLGSWIWEDVISRLDYPCLALDYPGRGTHREKIIDGLRKAGLK